MTINSLEKMIHKKIPITKAMGLRVKKSSLERVEIYLPFKKNTNHLGSAFGGSILACQAVSCWVWLLEFFAAHNILDAKVVLKSNKSAFKKPIVNDFKVVCSGPSLKVRQIVLKRLLKSGRANLEISSEAANQSATFQGNYVIVLNKSGNG